MWLRNHNWNFTNIPWSNHKCLPNQIQIPTPSILNDSTMEKVLTKPLLYKSKKSRLGLRRSFQMFIHLLQQRIPRKRRKCWEIYRVMIRLISLSFITSCDVFYLLGACPIRFFFFLCLHICLCLLCSEASPSAGGL